MFAHSLVIATIFSLLSGNGVGSCRSYPGASSITIRLHSTPNKSENNTEQENYSTSELKVLAEGFQSSITNPFIAVIRDQQTYAQLTKLESGLPKLDADFFKSRIAIAAFLGEKNTGGYRVVVEQNERREIVIRQKRPGRGQMVPQVITYPFKMVSLESSKATAVAIQFGDPWTAAVSDYTITRGTFTVSGGFAGRHEEFELVGGVRMMRYKKLATFGFAFRKKGESDRIVLEDLATGTIESGAIKISVLSAGDLIPPPTNGLGASGQLTNHEQNLSLTFVSLPTMIADGFGGGGTIEAVRVVPTAMNSPAR